MNYFLIDFFLVIDDIGFASYADINTISCEVDSVGDTILSLQDSLESLRKFFSGFLVTK